jgi:hypothetical protein
MVFTPNSANDFLGDLENSYQRRNIRSFHCWVFDPSAAQSCLDRCPWNDQAELSE